MKRQLIVTGSTQIGYEDITCTFLSVKRPDTDKILHKVGFGIKNSFSLVGKVYGDFELQDLLSKRESDVDLYRFVNGRTGKVDRLCIGAPFYVDFQRLALNLINECENSGRLSPDAKLTGVFNIIITDDNIGKLHKVCVKLLYNQGRGYSTVLEQVCFTEQLLEAYYSSPECIFGRLAYLIKGFNKLGIEPEAISYGFVYNSTVLKVTYT